MNKKPLSQRSAAANLLRDYLFIAVGCALFAIGFDLFLEPHSINIGGMSGLAMILVSISGWGSVGIVTALLNIPLFLTGYKILGKRFFFGSLFGMLLSSLFLDLFRFLPIPQTETLLSAIFGGVMSGAGLGLVFMAHASTGGSDIIARLLKKRLPDLKMGKLMLLVDLVVVTLTGVVFHDLTRTLYSTIVLYVSSEVIDALIYGFDYSSVALIITERHQDVYQAIDEQLQHGVTFLDGHGAYTGASKTVIMTAVRRRQVTELKQIVERIDPNAFMILQDAHQVLGHGFKKYSDEM